MRIHRIPCPAVELREQTVAIQIRHYRHVLVPPLDDISSSPILRGHSSLRRKVTVHRTRHECVLFILRQAEPLCHCTKTRLLEQLDHHAIQSCHEARSWLRPPRRHLHHAVPVLIHPQHVLHSQRLQLTRQRLRRLS